MIPVINYGSEEGKKRIKSLLSRTQLEHGNVQAEVEAILKNVKENGDAALFKYIEKFDKTLLTKDTLIVTDDEIKKAYEQTDEELISVIRRAADRIRAFHMKQKMNSWIEPQEDGETLGQLIRPVERAGIYVPGGKAAYPSTVLMDIIPAQVAGVKEIYMASPTQSDGTIRPATLVAAKEAGAGIIYKCGGAHAIAALAYGTETVKRVDKIVGPGNIYVTLAKRNVFGYVGIDSVAGPSEILIVADETANPEFIAADLLSQAEHDELASSILITTSQALAEALPDIICRQTAALSREDIIRKSLRDFGALIIVDNLEDAFKLANSIAPEHLEICTRDPFSNLNKVQNAGAVFLGHYTPEPLGDYMAGPNHTIPTSGTARFFSPLSVDDFIKKSSVLSFTKEAMLNLGADVIRFANAEGLTAHANSVRLRMVQNT